MSSSIPSAKRAREYSSSPSEDDQPVLSIEDDEPREKRKRKRKLNKWRSEKMNLRVDQVEASKSIEAFPLNKDSEDDVHPTQRDTHQTSNLPQAPTPGSPVRPTSISPITDNEATTNIPLVETSTTTPVTDPLIPKLAQITHQLAKDNIAAARTILRSITRTNNWQATATRDSILQIYNFTELLGDGKTQSIAQARMINDGRRREMELEEGECCIESPKSMREDGTMAEVRWNREGTAHELRMLLGYTVSPLIRPMAYHPLVYLSGTVLASCNKA